MIPVFADGGSARRSETRSRSTSMEPSGRLLAPDVSERMLRNPLPLRHQALREHRQGRPEGASSTRWRSGSASDPLHPANTGLRTLSGIAGQIVSRFRSISTTSRSKHVP